MLQGWGILGRVAGFWPLEFLGSQEPSSVDDLMGKWHGGTLFENPILTTEHETLS